MREVLKKVIPYSVQKTIRHLIDLPIHSAGNLKHKLDVSAGRKNPMIPPGYLMFVGSGSYEQTGNEFFQYFIDLGGLKPDDKILDVGCGTGRMALPLIKFLSGSYDGFDIIPAGIDWGQNNITADYPNFRFQLADIYNKMYNPRGTQKADEFVFPYEDESFDFVFLTSVFTHMFPPDMENYLSEISRVLRVGGRCLITYFLLNPESLKLLNAGASSLDFKYEFKDFRTINKKTPEIAIAFDENFIENLFYKYNLQMSKPIYYGSWCGRTHYLSYQDVVIATKN